MPDPKDSIRLFLKDAPSVHALSFSLSFPSSLLGLSLSLFPTLLFSLLSSTLLPFTRPLRRRETARSSSGGKKYSAQRCALRAEAAARFTCRFREIADNAKLRAARASNDEFSRRGESEIPVFSVAFVVNRPTGLPRVTKSMPDSKTVIGSNLLFSFFFESVEAFLYREISRISKCVPLIHITQLKLYMHIYAFT